MKIQYTSNLTFRKITVEGKSRYECFDKLWNTLGDTESRIDFFPAKSKVIEK